jgi:hypothetical protein
MTQFSVYAGYVNLLGKNINTLKNNTELILKDRWRYYIIIIIIIITINGFLDFVHRLVFWQVHKVSETRSVSLLRWQDEEYLP